MIRWFIFVALKLCSYIVRLNNNNTHNKRVIFGKGEEVIEPRWEHKHNYNYYIRLLYYYYF